MPSSGGKGSGDASLASVLIMIAVLGGGFVGLMFLLEHCESANRPAVRLDAGAAPR